MAPSYSLGSLLSVREVIECARSLAGSGADTVWIPETWGMECFSMLGAISQALPGPRLGSSIINVYSRSPSLVAMGAVTADALSGGRLILGIGASSRPIVESLHGISYDSPLERVREYVKVLRLACSGERIDHAGRLFSLSGFRLLVRPVREQIPIYLAAVGPQMISLASDAADGAILYLRPLGGIAETAAALKRKNPDFDVACQIITAVSDDEEAAMARAKATISFYVSVGRVYAGFLSENGYASEVGAIRSEYEKTRSPHHPSLVPDRMVRDLAVCGPPESCRAQLARFTDAGITHPILQFNPVGDVTESFGALRAAFSEAQ